MNKEEIQQVLPHRDPMLLVDSLEVDENGVCHAQYRIPEKPFYCEGHFPGNPIVPGVILCEIMAQASSGLYPQAFEKNLMVYRGMDNVKFRHEVRPGDLCETRATLIEHRGNLFICETTLSVGGVRCCQGRLTLAGVPKE